MQWQSSSKPVFVSISFLLHLDIFRYTLMLHCWAKEPNKRPNFRELSRRLQNISINKPNSSVNGYPSISEQSRLNLEDVTTSISLDTGAVLSDDTSKGLTETSTGLSAEDQKDSDSLSNGDLKQIVTLVSAKAGDTKLWWNERQRSFILWKTGALLM